MNHSTRWVHFKSSSEPLTPQRDPPEDTDESNQNKFVQTWQQRQSILAKLAPVLLKHRHSQETSQQHPNRDHSYQSYHHLAPSCIKNSSHTLNFDFGFIIELAQSLILDSHTNLDFYSDSQIKLLQRCLNTQIDPKKDFILIRKISEGQSGSVHLIKTRLSSLESLNQSNFYILKKVSKRVSKRIQPYSSIQTELSILLLSRTVGSGDERESGSLKPIPNLHLSFQTKEDLNLVIQFSPNGTISDYLQNRSDTAKPLEESILRAWSIDVISGLNWLHNEHYFCHRDIKPSNLLLDDFGHILLNDFGTAAPLINIHGGSNHLSSQSFSKSTNHRLIVPNQFRSVIIGTCDYIAPEILRVHLNQTIANLNQSYLSTSNGGSYHTQNKPCNKEEGNEEDLIDSSYGPEIDFWSFGISLYELVYGELPFFCQSISGTYDRIVSHQTYLKVRSLRYRGDDSDIDHHGNVQVSSSLQDFLKSLICNREVRIGCGSDGMEQVKNYEWFRGLDWNELRKSPVPNFTASPLHINQFGDSVCSHSNDIEENGGMAFNFSAFFGSSPGLTALQVDNTHHKQDQSSNLAGFFNSQKCPGKHPHQQQNEEDTNFWGFTYLPANPDEFNKPQEDRHFQRLKSSIKRSTANSKANVHPIHSTTPFKQDVDKFSTPIKLKHQLNHHSSAAVDGGNNRFRTSTNHPPPTNLINRSVRLKTGQDGQQIRLTEIDELMELNQFVLWTAKKSNPSHRRGSQHHPFDQKAEDSFDDHPRCHDSYLPSTERLHHRDQHCGNGLDNNDQKSEIVLKINSTHHRLCNLISKLDQLLLKSDEIIQKF